MEDFIVKTEGDEVLLEKRSDAQTAEGMERLAAYRKMTEENDHA